MDINLNLKTQMSLFLSQKMKLCIDVLGMSSTELNNYLVSNLKNDQFVSVKFENKFSSKNDVPNNIYATYIEEETLINFLEEQINFLNISSKIKSICLFIINNLDNNGYLEIEKNNLMNILKIDNASLEKVFEIIHSLHPIGVGTSNLQECLITQLKHKNMLDENLIKIINSYLDQLANENYSDISKALGVTTDQVMRYLDIIKTLNPIPSRGFNNSNKTNYIIPDAFIDIKKNKISVQMNTDNFPTINIKSTSSNDTEIKKVTSIVTALERRYETLEKIINFLVEKQVKFLLYGTIPLVNLTSKDISENFNLSTSTISRALKDKYIKVNNKIIPLKSLTTNNLDIFYIKRVISLLINKEDKLHPLSDNKLRSLLSEYGINISRRVIAKYREELNIKSSYTRREY